MKGKIKDQGIILKTSPYGDNSLILQVFCQNLGNIGILAKGWRNKKGAEPLQLLSEYEFNVYEPLESGLYLLSEASQTIERSYLHPKNWSAALCGAELIDQLHISAEETRIYFELLTSYLNYLQKLCGEPVPVFWRLMLRVMKLMGLSLEPGICRICQNGSKPAGYRKSDCSVLCQSCLRSGVNPQEVECFSPKASYLLGILPGIGNYLDQLRLDRNTIHELNQFLFRYYQAQFNKPLKLRSMGVLEQMY